MEYNFPVIRTTHPKPRPADETKLGFAKYFTDHMFVMDYDEGTTGALCRTSRSSSSRRPACCTTHR